MTLRDRLSRWPLLEQLRAGSDGTGAESMSQATRDLRPRNAGANVARSVCPFCGVGCGQLIFHRNGKIVSVEGDPASPISEGHLCPKGAATQELLTHAGRATKVKYRAPYASEWTEIDLDTAMDMVAERVWTSRDQHFEESRRSDLPTHGPAGPRTHDGELPLMQCASIAHLGGATLDNEENYLIKKLFTGGLGMVALSNQARI
jgi:formate dehydrogenase major subunit